jgi:hypothetical protein
MRFRAPAGGNDPAAPPHSCGGVAAGGRTRQTPRLEGLLRASSTTP